MKPSLIGMAILASHVAVGQMPAWRVHSLQSMEYPVVAAAAGVEGTVELELAIAADGSVKGATVLSGNPILGAAAKSNAMSWHFERALAVSRGEAGRVILIYAFRITGVCEAASCPTVFSFEVPNRVAVDAKAPHWQP